MIYLVMRIFSIYVYNIVQHHIQYLPKISPFVNRSMVKILVKARALRAAEVRAEVLTEAGGRYTQNLVNNVTIMVNNVMNFNKSWPSSAEKPYGFSEGHEFGRRCS